MMERSMTVEAKKPPLARRLLSNTLKAVGLHEQVRNMKFKLRANGLLPWYPLVPAEEFIKRCFEAIDLLKESGHQFGDYLEFGVSRGTSFSCMHQALRARDLLPKVRMIGFDGFQGLPTEATEQGWVPGDAHSTITQTRRHLRKMGVPLKDQNFVVGWYKDTLNEETKRKWNLNKASIIMVDCDLYSISKDVLWFVEPLIKEDAIIIFDDWGWKYDEGIIGQKEAFDEFLAAFPHFVTQELPAYAKARIFLLKRVP